MATSNGSTLCPQCKQEFTSRRYFLAHLRYPKNERCLQKYNGKTVSETPQKRQHDEVSEEDSPLSQASKTSELGEIMGAYAGISNHLGKMFPTSILDEITRENRETQQYASDEDSFHAGMFGGDSDDEAEEEEDPIEEEQEDLPHQRRKMSG